MNLQSDWSALILMSAPMWEPCTVSAVGAEPLRPVAVGRVPCTAKRICEGFLKARKANGNACHIMHHFEAWNLKKLKL